MGRVPIGARDDDAAGAEGAEGVEGEGGATDARRLLVLPLWR